MFFLSSFSFLPARSSSIFESDYECYPVSQLPGNQRDELDRGGKIIMPPSALETLTRINAPYPMLFKLTNPIKECSTHAGVLEFVADEEKVYLPQWMMRLLQLGDGESINVEAVTLPVAEYSKFQPLSKDFLDITDPKAVLENSLRGFACLTTNDVIAIPYNKRVYELRVLETRPGNAVNIIQCDMIVEFEAPQDMKEEATAAKQETPHDLNADDENDPFQGKGVRLDGKTRKIQMERSSAATATSKPPARGIPDFDYQPNMLQFDRRNTETNNNINTNTRKDTVEQQPEEHQHVGQEEQEQSGSFQGRAYSLDTYAHGKKADSSEVDKVD